MAETITVLPGIVQQFEVGGETYTKLPGIVQEFPFGTVLPGIVQQFELEGVNLTILNTEETPMYYSPQQDGWFPTFIGVDAPNGVERTTVQYFDCKHREEVGAPFGYTASVFAVGPNSLEHKPENPYFIVKVKQIDDDCEVEIRVDLDYNEFNQEG